MQLKCFCLKAGEILQGDYSKCMGVVAGTCGSPLLIASLFSVTQEARRQLSEDKGSTRGLMRKEG